MRLTCLIAGGAGTCGCIFAMGSEREGMHQCKMHSSAPLARHKHMCAYAHNFLLRASPGLWIVVSADLVCHARSALDRHRCHPARNRHGAHASMCMCACASPFIHCASPCIRCGLCARHARSVRREVWRGRFERGLCLRSPAKPRLWRT